MTTKAILFIGLIFFSFLIATPIVVSGGPENDCESWIARLRDGRLMVVFDRNPDWVSGDLYVTFSNNDGNTWDSVRPIITNPGDQATLCFVQMPDDTIRLWYGSNETGNYKIHTAYSLDGLQWTQQGPINLGWSSIYLVYDPTVILEPDSSLTMSYCVSGQGAYVSHCPYLGNWDTLKTRAAGSGFRPRIMKHSNSKYLIAYHRKSGSGSTNYDIFVRTSTDKINWSDSVRLTTNLNSHDPFACQAPDGSYLVYYAKYQSPAYNIFRRRSFDAINWSPEEQITNDLVYNTQPHLFIENSFIYLVYTHAIVYETNNDVYFERSYYTNIDESLENHELLNEIKVIPNPCVNQVCIITNNNSEITIFNNQGQKIGGTLQGKNLSINTATMKNGVYFIRIEQDKNILYRKLVVNH